MNPLDWTAQPFLTLYLCLMLLAAAVVLLVQEWVCRASAPAGRSSPEPGMPALDTIEMAYLAAGRARAADTVLLGLLTAGAATLDPGKSCFVIDATGSRLPPPLKPLGHEFSGTLSRDRFHLAIRSELDRVRATLVDRGLRPKEADIDRLRKITLTVTAVLVAFGALKMVVGASRGHPIGYLFILVLLTVLIGSIAAIRTPCCTRAGADAITAARARHARAARAPLEAELTLAFALTGVAVLSGTPYAAFAEEIRPSGGGGDGGGGGGGDGGGGCGGCS